MGLSSSKSKATTTATTKPVYEPQIQQANTNLNAAYEAQAPKLSALTDQLGGLAPDLFKQFQQGDPNVNAARGYNADVLGGKYLDQGNPYLSAMIQQTGDNTRNGLAASLGTRGLTGGSAFADIISRALAQNETNLRYTDYGNERSRMDQAASLAPALSAAQYQPLDALLQITQAQTLPSQLATGNAAATGGLLGQYVRSDGTSTQKQSQGLGASLGGLLGAGLAGWASGGFRGV